MMVFRLMFRYYNCTAGTIAFDGQDVKSLTRLGPPVHELFPRTLYFLPEPSGIGGVFGLL